MTAVNQPQPPTRSRLLLGIDVGNSKTHVAVAADTGRVLSFVAGPGASPQRLGPAASWQRIDELTTAALRAAAVESGLGAGEMGRAVVAEAYAVAGLDFPAEEEAFAQAGRATTGAAARTICNDIFAVLRTGVDRGEAGIAVVVGAGMNGVGRAGSTVVRFPALGALSGDWGGGMMLGEAAVGAACRAEDGRGPDTALRESVAGHFGVGTISDLLNSIVAGAVSSDDLLPLARLVLELADEGDAVSVALARRQADEVADLVRGAARRLGDAVEDGLPVVLSGSILRAGCRALDERLREALLKIFPGFRVAVAPGPPIVGAVLLAADLVPTPLVAADLARQIS